MEPVTQQYNPFTLPRFGRVPITRVLESADFPGPKLTVTFQKLDGPDESRQSARWTDVHAMYITGQHELCLEGLKEGEKPRPLEFPGLTAEEHKRLIDIELSNGYILQNAASFETMQPGEGHNVEFFVGICFRDKDMWNQINEFALEVNSGKAKTGEEAPAIATSVSSAALSEPVLATQNP